MRTLRVLKKQAVQEAVADIEIYIKEAVRKGQLDVEYPCLKGTATLLNGPLTRAGYKFRFLEDKQMIRIDVSHT